MCSYQNGNVKFTEIIAVKRILETTPALEETKVPAVEKADTETPAPVEKPAAEKADTKEKNTSNKPVETVAPAAPAEEKPVEVTSEKTNTESKPAEKPVATEKPVEKTTEKPFATEAPVVTPGTEEKPAEKPVATEASVEKSTPEEKPAEKPVATEAPVVTPATEEKSAEKPVATEASVEKSTAEEKITAEEKSTETPVADKQPVDATVAETKPTTIDFPTVELDIPSGLSVTMIEAGCRRKLIDAGIIKTTNASRYTLFGLVFLGALIATVLIGGLSFYYRSELIKNKQAPFNVPEWVPQALFPRFDFYYENEVTRQYRLEEDEI